MTDKRGLTIHFRDGTKSSFTFPKQVENDSAIASRMEKVLDQKSLTMEVDGSLLLIPISSIKYIQVYPAPEKLPDVVIKGAQLSK